jgi:hypothetical protein
MARTREYLGAAQVGAEVGVDRSTITKSLQRHGPGSGSARPFPPPRVRVGSVPGWSAEQLDDIREWFGQPVQGRRKSAEEKFADGMMAAVEQFEKGQRAERRGRRRA